MGYERAHLGPTGAHSDDPSSSVTPSASTSGVVAETSPIATQTGACLRLFERLSDLFAVRDAPIHGITQMQMLDQHGQLRVWASNIGALQLRHTPSSLDYRLRETPKFSAEVVSLLEDLAETLEDLHAIASGEKENRSGTPVLSQLDKLDDDCSDSPRSSDSDEARSEYEEEASDEHEPVSEIQELFQSIPETISSLFKLSVLIRNSSSRDRYAKALAAGSKTPVDPSYDINHVQNKFPRLRQKEMKWLGTRLGKAITQRRQYLWYCRDHREKMAKVIEPAAMATPEVQDADQRITALLNIRDKQRPGDTDDAKSQASKQPSTLAQTTASTVIPSQLESPGILERLDEESNDEDNRSVTSYASSVGENDEDNRLSVIQFEEVAKPNVPFECPYCWTIQKFNGHHAWRKHVMADLKPYVCTAEACDMKLFADARTWFTHELQNHLVEWLCCFCSRAPFATRSKFQSHLVKAHGMELGEQQLANLSKTCQKPLDQLMPSACRICDYWEGKLRELNKHIPADEALAVTPRQFRNHVRGHMEQLALFAIPRGYREDEDGESGKAAQGGGSNTSSNQSFPSNSGSSDPTLYNIARRFDARRMGQLLDRRGDELTITERVIEAAAGNEENGKEVMALLLDRRRGDIFITDKVVKTAAGNKGNGAEVMALLLDQWGDEIAATEEGDEGWAPVLWAAERGNEAIVKLLLENGATIGARDESRDGQTPLHGAAEQGHEAIVNLLLENGADVNSMTNNNQTALYLAATKGHLAIVKLLLENGATIRARDESRNGQTPLHGAAEQGREAIVKLLLEEGATIDAKDYYSQTPLYLAATKGHETIVKLLLDKGATIDARDEAKDSQTPLHGAAQHGHEAIVKMLLDRGATINAKARNVRTPLYLAVAKGHEAVVKLLLDKGAAANAKDDRFGWTPLLWDAANGNEAMIDLLADQTPTHDKQGGEDWICVFNNQAPRLLDIDLVHTLHHQSIVFAVRFSHDGKYVATGCNLSAQIFDVQTGEKLCHLAVYSGVDTGRNMYIRSVCFSPDGRYLATGADDRLIRVWDIHQRQIRHTFSGHEHGIYSLGFSSDGRTIASSSGDCTVRLWDIDQGSHVRTLTIENGTLPVAISPDAKYIAAGVLDNSIGVWDLDQGHLLERLEGPEGNEDSISSVAFSPDNKDLVTGSLDQTIKMWELSTPRGIPTAKGGRCVRTFEGHRDYVLSVLFTPDNQWVLSGSRDRGVQFWDPRTGHPQLVLQGHKDSVISVATSPTGGYFATASGDGKARIWSYRPIMH